MRNHQDDFKSQLKFFEGGFVVSGNMLRVILEKDVDPAMKKYISYIPSFLNSSLKDFLLGSSGNLKIISPAFLEKILKFRTGELQLFLTEIKVLTTPSLTSDPG